MNATIIKISRFTAAVNLVSIASGHQNHKGDRWFLFGFRGDSERLLRDPKGFFRDSRGFPKDSSGFPSDS
eukprot:2487549-Pyramimonas_sp.AAC.1